MFRCVSRLFNKVVAQPCTSVRNFMNFRSPLFVQLTPQLYAEPLKKKKRLDPAILKQREERRRKRLEKQIRRLQKHARQLKPIEECEIPLEIINDKSRVRNVTVTKEEEYRRFQLMKKWGIYRMKQHLNNVQMIDRILYSQQRALDELKLESEELYREAIKLDESLIPFKAEGPCETPPIENYESPDGDYIDISKKWEN